MRFKISVQENNSHKRLLTCVAWNSTEELYSCGEDHLLICWRLESGTAHSTIITEFPNDFYPTDMQWHPYSNQAPSITKQSSLDVLLITTADGKYHLVNKNGRIEKSIDAHKGATILGRWSNDGSALLTAGEDGFIKIYSRSGMLRSTLVKASLPVLTSSWSPDSSMILYSQGGNLLLQPFNSNCKPRKWHAHDSLILTACWSQRNELIVSGGEDCRYKIWDVNGNQLYNSTIGDHPVTAISWCHSSGDCFVVGSFNTIKLCDKNGWSHSMEKVNTGSIYNIAWSSDGTQVAMACSNGKLLTGNIINRRLESDNYEATLIRRKLIEVREVGNDVSEVLEVSDRVVHLEFAFGHLVIITPAQCHVYSVKNLNTPVIFNLKKNISAVLLAEKHFLIVETSTVSLYSYQGRLLGTPRWKGLTEESLYLPCISLCGDTLVIRDQKNEKLVHILEISCNKPITESQPYLHLHNVTQLALNHIGIIKNRQLALIDVNKDLFLVAIKSTGRVCKIAAMAHNIVWAADTNVLAAMLDTNLSVWLCPNCVHYSDRKVIRRTRIDKENSEFGKQPSIVSVHNGMVMVRRGDGAVMASSFYNLFTSLYQHISQKMINEALSLCRIAENKTLWTCMAVMATDNKELHAAEESYAAIARYDKVDCIRYIKSLSNTTERYAEMALLAGDLLAAEGILLQSGLIKEAIRINTEVYNWNRLIKFLR
ncbi:intraflagellar transport protein 80 homolog isoform X2 [Linepithema humile]|uniref:intraflagellar transport protein 80 homolog isoform X2 n=1 Tax=Linepithema humile TaxID=83485 RepID=UPI00351EB962